MNFKYFVKIAKVLKVGDQHTNHGAHAMRILFSTWNLIKFTLYAYLGGIYAKYPFF